MDCPECGYALSSFEKECPRCKHFKAKGLSPALPVRAKPEEAAEPAPAPRPLRNITPEPINSASGDIAPLFISTHRIASRRPWLVAAVAAVLAVGLLAWWQARQAAITKAIVLAARQGACERMPGYDTDRQIAACTQLAGGLTYHLVRDAPEHATVTFFLAGMASSLNVVVNQDDEGEWHAVAATSGDEGARTPWADRRFADPSPAVSPATPAPVTLPPAPTYSPAPAYSPAPPTDAQPSSVPPSGAPPDAAPSDSSSYTMRTQAGGGPPPKL